MALPSFASLPIGVDRSSRLSYSSEEEDELNQQSLKTAKIELLLQDLSPEVIQLILSALANEDCAWLYRLQRSNKSVRKIYEDADFWEQAIELKKWQVDWVTGLSPMEYFKMVCMMEKGHRTRLFAITKETTVIPQAAFENCTPLALTSLPDGLTDIKDFAFADCTSLALTSLPDSIRKIRFAAFADCTSLALTSLPKGITEIGRDAFVDCTSLALKKLPDSITTIFGNTFSGCKSLALTSLPDDLKHIGEKAFYQCTSLELQELPDRLSYIGKDAFDGVALTDDIQRQLEEKRIKSIMSPVGPLVG